MGGFKCYMGGKLGFLHGDDKRFEKRGYLHLFYSCSSKRLATSFAIHHDKKGVKGMERRQIQS